MDAKQSAIRGAQAAALRELSGCPITMHPALARALRAEKRAAVLEAAMVRAAEIIDRNLYHQREKVEDASAILKQALQE